MTLQEKIDILAQVRREKDLPIAQSKLEDFGHKVIWDQEKNRAVLIADLQALALAKMKEKNIKQKDIADAMGVGRQNINDWLKHRRRMNQDKLAEFIALLDIL